MGQGEGWPWAAGTVGQLVVRPLPDAGDGSNVQLRDRRGRHAQRALPWYRAVERRRMSAADRRALCGGPACRASLLICACSGGGQAACGFAPPTWVISG